MSGASKTKHFSMSRTSPTSPPTKRQKLGEAISNESWIEIIKSGNIQALEELQGCGIPLPFYFEDSEGNSCFHIAAMECHLQIFTYFMNASKEIEPSLFQRRNNLNLTPLHLAVCHGHLPIVEFILDHGISIEEKDKEMNKSIHLAADNGNLPIMKYLLARGADIKGNITGRWGTTLLFKAVKNGYLDIIKCILEENCQSSKVLPIIALWKNSDWTALHVASQEGHLTILKYFLSEVPGSKINKETSLGVTPFQIAAQEGHLEIVKYIFECGTTIDHKNNNQRTALHLAAQRGHLEIIEFLLAHGSNPKKKDLFGCTALHLAAEGPSHFQVIKYLLAHGSSSGEKDIRGFTALYYTTIYGNLEIVQYLVNHGSDVEENDKFGVHVLHVAAQYGKLEIIKYFLSCGCGCDINVQDNQGRKSVHYAAMGGHVEALKYLLTQENALEEKATNFSLAQCVGQHKPLSFEVLELLMNYGYVRVEEIQSHCPQIHFAAFMKVMRQNKNKKRAR